MNKDGFKIALFDNDNAKPGLRAIGSYQVTETPSVPDIYHMAVSGDIAAESTQLIGRMEGALSARGQLTVTRFVREGNQILADIQYVRAAPIERPGMPGNVKRGYVWAKLPDGLPPGRYYVKVQLVEYLREGGELIVAPKTNIRHPST